MEIAQEAIYTDDAGNILGPGDPRAAFLLVGKGCEIPQDVQEKLLASKKARAPTVPLDASAKVDSRQKRIVTPALKRK